MRKESQGDSTTQLGHIEITVIHFTVQRMERLGLPGERAIRMLGLPSVQRTVSKDDRIFQRAVHDMGLRLQLSTQQTNSYP